MKRSGPSTGSASTPLLDVAPEAVEGAEGDALLVGGAAGCALKSLAGEVHQPGVVVLPQGLGRLVVARLQPLDQGGDRPRRRRRSSPAGMTWFGGGPRL